jgi:formylglycine-generating enzyme required for sulfatase activity
VVRGQAPVVPVRHALGEDRMRRSALGRFALCLRALPAVTLHAERFRAPCRRTVLAAAALPALLWAPVAGAQQPSAAEQSDPTLPPEPCMSRPGQGPEMVLIEGGTFLTGSPEGDDEAGPGALRRCSAGMWVCWTSMT